MLRTKHKRRVNRCAESRLQEPHTPTAGGTEHMKSAVLEEMNAIFHAYPRGQLHLFDIHGEIQQQMKPSSKIIGECIFTATH